MDFVLSRIQELDGGFFEKFGLLFHENSTQAAAIEKQEKDKVAEHAAKLSIPDDEDKEDEEPAQDSSETSPETPSSSDTEPEDQLQFICAALNVSKFKFVY